MANGTGRHESGGPERCSEQAGEERCSEPGVLVVLEAVHLCMVARGVEKASSRTVTVAHRGALSRDAAARATALEHVAELMHGRGPRST